MTAKEFTRWLATSLVVSATVLVVSVVVLLVAAFAAPYLMRLFAFSQPEIAEAQCKRYYDAAIYWQRIKGEWPASLEEMVLKPANPGEENFIWLEDDPWGNRYVLETPGERLRVRSFGPDGKRGTADDIICAGE